MLACTAASRRFGSQVVAVLVWCWALLLSFLLSEAITYSNWFGCRFLSAYQLPAVISAAPARRPRFWWFQISRQVLSFLLCSHRRGFLQFPRVIVRSGGSGFKT